MKQKLLLIVGLLTFCSSMSFGQIIYNEGKHSFLPKDLSYDKKVKLIVPEGGEDNNWTWFAYSAKIYDHELKEIHSVKLRVDSFQGSYELQHIAPIPFEFKDLDKEFGFVDYGSSLLITQTLFNNDNKYEYLFPKYTISNGEMEIIGIDVISEDGATVKSFSFEGETLRQIYVMELYKWEGNLYTCLDAWFSDNSEQRIIYLLESSSNSLKRVAANNPIMKVFPSIAPKSTMVTVELDEATQQNGGTLVISNANGQTVYSRPVRAGEPSVQIATNRLPKGMYVVSFASQGQTVEASKLIIR